MKKRPNRLYNGIFSFNKHIHQFNSRFLGFATNYRYTTTALISFISFLLFCSCGKCVGVNCSLLKVFFHYKFRDKLIYVCDTEADAICFEWRHFHLFKAKKSRSPCNCEERDHNRSIFGRKNGDLASKCYQLISIIKLAIEYFWHILLILFGADRRVNK